MKIMFRVSADARVGLGHLRRCLSLAQALRPHATCKFLLAGDEAAQRYLQQFSFETELASIADEHEATLTYCTREDINLIVADSYALTASNLQQFTSAGAKVVVVDDVADRELLVDVVINGSVGAERLGYRVAATTEMLLGPRYAILRPEFAEPPTRVIRESIENVLITVGGSDPHQLSPRLVAWTRAALGDVALNVVVGPLFSADVIAQLKTLGVALHYDPPAMRDLMLQADVALCSGGQTTYELAATGVPALGIMTAENQRVNLTGFSQQGALHWLGDVSQNLEHAVNGGLLKLAAGVARRMMSAAGRAVVDGQGSVRLAEKLTQGVLVT
jgi:UDP-2,4-diacetamido-2,4,6-trideoxy-beta-L-altropyranose hydrolase